MANTESASFSYVYDYLGRMQSITYPDGEVLSYGYDAGGQVKSAKGVHYGRSTTYVADIGYDQFGQRVYMKYGNGVETKYVYDENRRWLDSIHTSDGTSRTIQAMSYSFDAVGNVMGVSNHASSYQVDAGYTYDSLYQLTRFDGTIGAQSSGMSSYTSTCTQQFSFDAIGNMTGKQSTLSVTPQKTVGAALDYALDYAYYSGKPHQAERIGSLWYRYDANGNEIEERQGGHSSTSSTDAELTSEGDLRVVNRGFGLTRRDDTTNEVYMRSLVWDEENRLKRSVESKESVDYRYGADGNRAVKYSGSGETLYFDAMWQATTDYPSLRQSKHIYVGETRIATRCNIEGEMDVGYEELNTYYYHGDHLGSAQMVTDASGEVYEHMEYTPYGELWIEAKSDTTGKVPFRFTGKELDTETGLYYYGARYMDPKTSRWISGDPALEEYLPVAPTSDEAKKKNQNLPGMGGVFNVVNIAVFNYGCNNPVTYKDPNGLDVDPSPTQGSYLIAVAANRPAIVVTYSGETNKAGAMKGTALAFAASSTITVNGKSYVDTNDPRAVSVPIVSGSKKFASAPVGTYNNVRNYSARFLSQRAAAILTSPAYGGIESTVMDLGILPYYNVIPGVIVEVGPQSAGDLLHQGNINKNQDTDWSEGCISTTGLPRAAADSPNGNNARTNKDRIDATVGKGPSTIVVRNQK